MKKQFENFINTLKEYEEIYFVSGDLKQDYEQIKEVIKAQGYWSGVYNKYYFNDKLELEKVGNRW